MSSPHPLSVQIVFRSRLNDAQMSQKLALTLLERLSRPRGVKANPNPKSRPLTPIAKKRKRRVVGNNRAVMIQNQTMRRGRKTKRANKIRRIILVLERVNHGEQVSKGKIRGLKLWIKSKGDTSNITNYFRITLHEIGNN